METEQHRRKHTTHTAPPSTTAAEAHQTPDTRHPMGSVSGWMLDLGTLGVVTGLAAAAAHMTTATAGWDILLATPILLGLAASIAGAVAGATLRALRGQVHPVMGVLIAGIAVNLTGSLVTEALPWQQTAIIEGKAAPLSIAILLLIPVIAVLRWRRQSTLPWLVLAGALAGILIGLS